MKVLYVHHSGAYGGSCRSLGIALPHLINKGIEPHVVSPPGPANEYFRKITPHVTTLDTHCFPLSMTINSIAPDIVHCNELGLISAAKIAKQLGKKVVMHARTMPDKKFPRINRWTHDQIQRYSDHTICITGSVEQSLSGVEPKSIVYNPIEKICEPVARDCSNDEVVFLSLSAIQKSKGVFDIVEAANILKQHSHIKIKIAGKLSPKNPKKLTVKQRLLVALGLVDFTSTKRLLELVENYGLNNLELLGHVDNVDAEIAKCDVMLAPMHLNAPPRSVYEAGIHSLPSILSMEDKVEDVIEHNFNGLLIDEQNPKQLADAILKLANDGALRDRLGNAANERFRINHDPLRCADAIFTIYERVLSRG